MLRAELTHTSGSCLCVCMAASTRPPSTDKGSSLLSRKMPPLQDVCHDQTACQGDVCTLCSPLTQPLQNTDNLRPAGQDAALHCKRLCSLYLSALLCFCRDSWASSSHPAPAQTLSETFVTRATHLGCRTHVTRERIVPYYSERHNQEPLWKSATALEIPAGFPA